MGKKGRLEGDSGSITTQGKVGPQSLRNYLKAQAFGIRTARFTFLNGNASGGATILAGPNRTAMFPLAAPAVAGRDRGGLYLVQRPTGGHVDRRWRDGLYGVLHVRRRVRSGFGAIVCLISPLPQRLEVAA